MNKSNYHIPPIPPNCCCSCNKKDYSSRGGRSAKYAESSPDEADEDEDECGNLNFKNNDKSFVRDEVYENLIDLIDDQMMSTMSALRKKARKFMKTELEQSFSSDTNSRPCTCPEDIRNKGVNVIKKANEINYQPQSTFLKKMVQQYQCKQSDYSELDESDSPAVVKKPIKTKNKHQNFSKANSPPTVNQNEKFLNSCCCKCFKDDSFNTEGGCSQKKSEHVSRSKKKTKCRGKRKRKSDGKCESKDHFEPNLKQPHENSCERCWRFASPSRSPVNKPDQRYDPNFRRGHSCISLDPKKTDDITDVKENQTTPCKSPQTNVVSFNVAKNFPSTSSPQISSLNKTDFIQHAPCEDYSARCTPLTERKGIPCRSQTYSQSNPYIQMNELDFEYPSPRYPETSRTQQTCVPRPHSCEKIKEKESLEKGIIYSSKVRNLITRPQTAVPAPCTYKEEEYKSSLPYKEVCGRGRLENLDPCMRRSLPAKKKTPCEDMDMSKLRGDTSRGSGLGSGLDTSRLSGLGGSKGSGLSGSKGSGLNGSKGSGLGGSKGNGLDMTGEDFDKSGQNDSAQGHKTSKDNSKRKGAPLSTTKKSKSSDEKKKSPKIKSPSKTPKGSPQESKVRKDFDKRKGTCSTKEAQAYFKIPSKPQTPEKCGLSHPIQKCNCYPRSVKNLGNDIYCCHCEWQKCQKNESTKVGYDQVDSTQQNKGCCCPPPSLPETSKSQGRHLSPVLNRSQNQKPTLPDIDEYPEQLFDINTNKGSCLEVVLPCPYREHMNGKLLNNLTNASESTYEKQCCRNGNAPYKNVNPCAANPNVSFRTEYENSPRYCNENIPYGNYSMYPNMNAGCGMDFPRKYCVMYMTKGKECAEDDVEVLVEELTQNCPFEKDGRMSNVSEKMTRMYKCPTESMALRFQKGVSERNKAFQKSRILYF